MQYVGGLTGVRSSGVEMGELSLFSLIPLPKSKSQILTGEIWEEIQVQSHSSIYFLINFFSLVWNIYLWHHRFPLSFINTKVHITILEQPITLYYHISCPLNQLCWNMFAVNSLCLHSHRECFQVSGLYVPFLEKNMKAISYLFVNKIWQLYCEK